MNDESRINRVKEKILPVLTRYQVKKASFFGSFARGKVNRNSDVDILVELSDASSLFDFINLKNELEDTVGRKVDLVEYDTLKSSIRNKILSEQVSLF
jgi:predicted nucleotidyltransferase